MASHVMPVVFLSLFVSLILPQSVLGQGGGIVSPGDDEKHLQGCVIPTTKVLMAFNETLTLQDNCLLMTCREDRTIEYKHCIAPEVPHQCTLSDYNTSLTYPACCPVVQCDDQVKINGTVLEKHFNQTLAPITDETSAEIKPEKNLTNITTETTEGKPKAKELERPVEIRTINTLNIDRVKRYYLGESYVPKLGIF